MSGAPTNDNSDMFQFAADRIVAACAIGPFAVAVEVLAWREKNGAEFMHQVAARIANQNGMDRLPWMGDQ